MKTLFRWLNKFLLGWTVLLYFLPRVRWEEKRSMPKGPVLLVSNHKNHMDFLLLMAVFYFRYLTWAECEAAEYTWDEVETAQHTWESFQLAVPPEE